MPPIPVANKTAKMHWDQNVFIKENDHKLRAPINAASVFIFIGDNTRLSAKAPNANLDGIFTILK